VQEEKDEVELKPTDGQTDRSNGWTNSATWQGAGRVVT
jgi:hypothetical protein